MDIADMKTSNDTATHLTTYMLGTSVGVAIYDPKVKVGGLLHFMLPEAMINMHKALKNPYFFADTGIPLLFRSAYKLGAEKERIVCRLAGGAHFLGLDDKYKLGVLNHLAASMVLSKNGVDIKSEHVGGMSAMTLTMQLSTGRITVCRPGGEETEL